MKQIFSILFVLASCNSDNNESEPSNVKFSEVYYGDHFNGDYTTPKANLVIKSQTEWENLIAKMKIAAQPWQNSVTPPIDFKKDQVIAVIDQIRNYGGYSIDITKITQTNNRIIVKVEQLNPGGFATVITQPYHIVTMPKSNKKVVFE
nr:protease complex subunit PrcB family protein [Flavobacterium sp. ASV13]